MQLGDFNVSVISGGSFWLDGGAMFGVVPKLLWEKKAPADPANRIELGLNCLLIQTGTENILVDTGCGLKYSEKEFRIYGIDQTRSVLEGLKSRGLTREDITLVANTHLHFDHCGGNTWLDAGEAVPTFPNATYLVGKTEFDAARCPNERTSASYFPWNWEPLEARGQLRVVPENHEILPGVRFVHTPGHTAGHQSVLVESGGRTLFYLADLCPTTAHVPLPWIMGYDLHPLTTLATRREIYRQAVEGRWLLLFEHDLRVPSGYLEEREGKYVLVPAPLEP